MEKPGDLKTARGIRGPTAKTINSITTTTATPSSASIKQNLHTRKRSQTEWMINTSSANRRKPEDWSEVSTRSPSPSSIRPESTPNIGPRFRVRSANRTTAISKRAKLKRPETRPTGPGSDESKANSKRSASSILKLAAMTVGYAVGSAVCKVRKAGKAFDKASESLLADKARALLPAAMAGVSNAEILRILKHVEHPKADSAKYLREVAGEFIPEQSRKNPLHYLRAFVKGRNFNSEQNLCTDLMSDLKERTKHGAAPNQLPELSNCYPSFDDLMEEVKAWRESPLKDKVQALLQGAKAGFDSRQQPDLQLS